MPDALAVFDVVRPAREDSPWRGDRFEADIDRLEEMLSVCAAGPSQWKSQEGGAIGLALDLWTADEIRRAGWEPDAVWPRTTPPRVLPASVARAIGRLPKTMRGSPVAARILKEAGAGKPTVFGEFFPKQTDVIVADWDRGVELLVSTKGMTGSFGNNVKNRWEEFVGDLRNIRGRHPLAALGVLYMSDVGILASSEVGPWERLRDMLRKLRLPTASGPAYDGTALVLAEAVARGRARLVMEAVDDDLEPGQMLGAVLRAALTRLPEAERVAARDTYGRRGLPTAEAPGAPDVLAEDAEAAST